MRIPPRTYAVVVAIALLIAGCANKSKPKAQPDSVEAITKDVENGRLDAAAGKLQEKLNKNPQDIEALKILGRVYFLRKNFDMAEQKWTQVLGLDPKQKDVRLGLAEMYDLEFDPWKAVEQYEAVLKLEIDPGRKADIEKKIREQNAKKAVLLMREAEDYNKQKNLKEAERLAREAMALNPENIDALFMLGEMAYRTPDHSRDQEALKLLSEAARLNPGLWTARTYLGDIYRDQGEPGKALGEYQEAFKSASGEGKSSLAARILRVSADRLNLKSNDPEALYEYGRLQLLLPDWAEGLKAWSRALDLNPGMDSVAEGLLSFYRDDRDLSVRIIYDDAVEELLSVIKKIDPKWKDIWALELLAGEVKNYQSDPKSAAAWFEKALNALPPYNEALKQMDWRTWMMRGILFKNLGRYEDARDAFTRGKVDAPYDALADIARLLSELPREEKNK